MPTIHVVTMTGELFRPSAGPDLIRADGGLPQLARPLPQRKRAPGMPGLLLSNQTGSPALVPAAELEVDADLGNALAFLDVDEHRRRNRGREGVRFRAEIIIIVFGKTAQKLVERVFAADPNGPAAASLARGCER